MMNCREAGDWLSPYLDEELDARRRARLEAHLAGCPNCSRELATLREAARLLAGPRIMARPEGLLTEFKQRLAASAPPRPRPWWHQPWAWSLAGVTATAAAAGLIVSLSGPLVPKPRSPGVASLESRVEPPADTRAGTRTPPAGPRTAMPHETGAGTGVLGYSPPPGGLISSRSNTPVRTSAGAPEPAAVAQAPTRMLAPSTRRDADAFIPIAESTPPAAATKGTSATRRSSATEPAAPPGQGRVETPVRRQESRAALTIPREQSARVTPEAEATPSPAVPGPPERQRADETARIEIVIHRPYPDADARSALGARGTAESPAGAGAAGAAAGASATGPTGSPAPPSARGVGATRAAPGEVPLEVVAAMRAPVAVKVSNVTLTGLTDRLAAEAEVPIVVQDPGARDLRVSAEVAGVPLYQALERVAEKANLVIAPRPGGIALQSAGPSPAPRVSPTTAPENAARVWSPAWGGLPQNGFLLPVAAQADEGDPAALARRARPTLAGGGPADKPAPDPVGAKRKAPGAPAQGRVQTAEEALAQQNRQMLQKAAAQLAGMKPPTQLLACPHCRRPVPQKQTFSCPKCKRTVAAADTRCAHCGEAHPARCPACRKPLAVPTTRRAH